MRASRPLRRAGTVAGLVAALVLGVVTTARAAEALPPDRQHASDLSTAPAGCNTPLLAVPWGSTCFNSNGDYQWSRDYKADGLTVMADLLTSYEGHTASRACIAGPAADNGGWCNWDVGEEGCVKFWLVLLDGTRPVGESTASPWYSAKTGKPKNCEL